MKQTTKNKKIYNQWITEAPKVVLQNTLLPIILQDVLVTIEGSNLVELTYVDYEKDENDNHKMVHGYPVKNILAYMHIPTMDIDAEGWHGEYTDGLEPRKDGNYLMCVETKKYGRTSYRLTRGYWQKNRFFGCNYSNSEVIGWREYPKPFISKEAK